MLRLLVLFSACLFSLKLFGSPQMPDYIIYNNDTIATYNLILEKYLQKSDTDSTGKLFGLSFRDGASFNCWRGYQAIYEIQRDSFFLLYIIDCGELRRKGIDKKKSAEKIKAIFGDRVKNGKVYITWFSGSLSFPLNYNRVRWDGVFYSIYEKEAVVMISKGKIVRIQNVENYIDKPNGIDRMNEGKLSDTIFSMLKKVKWKDIGRVDCSEKYLITIDRKGRVSKVSMYDYRTKKDIREFWMKREYNYCIRTIYNALKKLRFDIIKDKGKPFSEDIYIEIRFNTDTGQIENWTK